MQNHLGFFVMDDEGERAVIAILDSLDRSALVETFCEEWAHARTAWLCDEEDDNEDPWHHPTFWAEYGRLVKASREIVW